MAIAPGRARFKAPEFDGNSDVELFIRHFTDVSQANNWNDAAALLHLRRSLVGKAVDCGAGNDVAAILAALRLRFGVTPSQARDQLKNLTKEAKGTWHEFGMRADKLVNLAFPTLPPQNRVELAIDNFKRGINNRALQTMAAAVRTAEEFMQAGASGPQRLNAVETEDDVDNVTTMKDDRLAQILSAVNANTEAIRLQGEALRKLMEKREPLKPKPKSGTYSGCFNCGSASHRKKDCPHPIKVNEIEMEDPENSDGPQDM
jgi:hypothetical protein